MELSDRKKKILQIVVDDYIATAQPVSSKSITEKYMSDLSSATVRNELSHLEEMGYLTQPHTSSGRVPSIEAYKLYVTDLIETNKLSIKDVTKIKKAFSEHADNLETVVQNAVKVISDLTDYTSVGYTSHNENDKIEKISIFRHKSNQGLLLIVTENILIRDKFISIPESMTDGQIIEANDLLNKLFIGKKLDEIIHLQSKISEEFEGYKEIFDSVMNAIEDYIVKDKPEVIVDGENKFLKHPEYTDTEKVKNFLSVVTDKDRLASLLEKNSSDIEINIKIGGEEGQDIPEDCSLVTATYSAGGAKLGTYGVIGPLRMDYQKVISVLNGVGKIMEEMLKNDDNGKGK